MNNIVRKISLAVQEGQFAHSYLLRPFSGLWGVAAKMKNWFYDRNLAFVASCSVPVVSVGALTAGGTHKTPLVHLLAKTLMQKGSIAILSRGYRTADEPLLLQRRLPGVAVCVGKDRVASAEKARQAGAHLLLLDDGFQYRRLHRDFELLTIAKENPYGYGTFLPRGLLRDSPSRLKEADAIFINGEPSEDLLKMGGPFISVQLRKERILDLQGNLGPDLSREKIGAFCGIARPSRFFQTLKEMRVEPVDVFILGDHEQPKEEQLVRFAMRCSSLGATALICTEKDAVKISLNSSFPLPIFYLEMELQVVSGHSEWKNLIEKIVLKMNNYQFNCDE